METNGDVKRHGRWKSDVGKGGYIEDTFEKNLSISQGQDYDFSKFSALVVFFIAVLGIPQIYICVCFIFLNSYELS